MSHFKSLSGAQKMSNAGQVVQGFMGAMGKGDFSTARKFLHDNLSFRGPMESR